MSPFDVLSQMAPAARAVAEVSAREAGLSLSQWLELLVYEHRAAIRHYRFLDRPSTVPDNHSISGSATPGTHVLPSAEYDVMATYVPFFRLREMATPSLTSLLSDYPIDETTWSALKTVAAFPPRINHAAILLSAAFEEADVSDFHLPPTRRASRVKATQRWYDTLVDTSVHRSREVRNALAHRWTPRGRAERLWGDAFVVLCDMTQARYELMFLYTQDRGRASIELAKHLEVATQQFELSAHLLADVEGGAETSDEQRFAQLRATLLERAGGGVSLTQGAELLGMTRQALHKRIKAGSALGMMEEDEIVLPRLQWIEREGKTAFVPGLSDIVRLFDRAGGWSALQFLLDPDPNLAQTPIEALKAGRNDEAIAAARAFLGLDEA